MGRGTGEAGRSIWEKHEFEGETIQGLSLGFILAHYGAPDKFLCFSRLRSHNPPTQRCDEDSVK